MLGIDIEKTSRFNLSKDETFVKENFTQNELEYAFKKSNPALSLCGFFCAKEAVIKTLDNQAIKLNEIEITHEKKGHPKILFLNNNVVTTKLQEDL